MVSLAESRKEPLFVLILDTLQNPQNLGTLLRSAEAFGVHGILLPLRHTVDITPAVVNASSGASEHLLVGMMNLAQAMEQLKEHDVWILGLEGSDESTPIEKVRMTGPLAIVVGSEGEGMRTLVRKVLRSGDPFGYERKYGFIERCGCRIHRPLSGLPTAFSTTDGD